jgi:tripartite-type tricarboxylate transporter receptor subunit TctC
MDRIKLLVIALAGGLFAAATHAQTYPTGPITLVNPYAAGGPADLIARTVGTAMSEQLGQQIVILGRASPARRLHAASVQCFVAHRNAGAHQGDI